MNVNEMAVELAKVLLSKLNEEQAKDILLKPEILTDFIETLYRELYDMTFHKED